MQTQEKPQERSKNLGNNAKKRSGARKNTMNEKEKKIIDELSALKREFENKMHIDTTLYDPSKSSSNSLSLSSTGGNIQSTTGNFQSTTGNFQSTTGNFQSTTGNFQSTTGNFQSTRSYLQSNDNHDNKHYRNDDVKSGRHSDIKSSSILSSDLSSDLSPELHPELHPDLDSELKSGVGLDPYPDVKIKREYSEPNQFGYHTNNLEDYCGIHEEEFRIEPSKPQSLPKVFKVLTWNIWGLNKRDHSGEKYLFLSELMMLRMEKIVSIIVEADPDIIIFQEMSYESLGMIKGFMRQSGIKYNIYCENFSKYNPEKFDKVINRDLDTCVFSKYVPSFITQHKIPGNLGYWLPVTFVSFGEICIVGCHLQAGSKHSPGQEKVWHHYSRCRTEQLFAIKHAISTICPDKTIIMCGDFNMHLDGNKSSWPEIKWIADFKVIDTWRCLYPKKAVARGFTEDTDVNHMRWHMKFIKKKFRYDGFFLKNSLSPHALLVPISATLIGTEGYLMDDDMFDNFLKVMGNTSKESETLSKSYHPSDHFGVMTTFSRVSGPNGNSS
jgi:hypothetical protein